MTKNNTIAAGLCFLASAWSSLAGAALVINVGSFELLPNTPNQKIPITVTGGDRVEGLNFYAQIADGGPALAGTIVSPKLTAVDLLTGTIFANDNLGQFPVPSYPQAIAAQTLTESLIGVIAQGRLATLTVDTTGFAEGSWQLRVTNTALGDTDFAGIAATITNGSITIPAIPEPSIAIGLPVFAFALARQRRRRGTAHPVL